MKLKYKADRTAAELRAPGIVHIAGGLPEQENFPGRWLVEQANHVEQGAFA